jgi:hypothetical protein
MFLCDISVLAVHVYDFLEHPVVPQNLGSHQHFLGVFTASNYASIAATPVYKETTELVMYFPCKYTCPVTSVKCPFKSVQYAAHPYICSLID